MKFIENLENYGFQGNIWARHVMVPGYTDNEKSMEEFVKILEPIKNKVERIEILPYHTAGVKKYEELGLDYSLKDVPEMDKKKAKTLERYANKIFAESLREGRTEKVLEKKKAR